MQVTFKDDRDMGVPKNVLFIWIVNLGEFFSEQWAKIPCFRVIFLGVIKNNSSPVNFPTY